MCYEVLLFDLFGDAGEDFGVVFGKRGHPSSTALRADYGAGVGRYEFSCLATRWNVSG